MGLFGLPSFDTIPSLIRPLWAYGLQSASWNGCDFNLTATEPTEGRRVVIHEYPNRNLPWVEDLGRANQIIPIRGYLVGDDVISQRDAFKKACRTVGPGKLIHPSLGALDATLLNASFGEVAEAGRVVELSLTFIISGTPAFPDSDSSSTASSSAGDVSASANSDFLSKAASFIKSGIATVGPILNVATAFAGAAEAVAGLATHPLASVKGIGAVLPSNLSTGRYQGNLSQPNPALAGLVSTASPTTNLLNATAAAVANGAVSRSQVNAAVTTVTTSAGAL